MILLTSSYLRLSHDSFFALGCLFSSMSDQPENIENVYSTADLGLAAFLLTKGAQLISAGREKNRYKFIFSEQAACKKLAITYVNSEFSRFDANLKNLKNLVS